MYSPFRGNGSPSEPYTRTLAPEEDDAVLKFHPPTDPRLDNHRPQGGVRVEVEMHAGLAEAVLLAPA